MTLPISQSGSQLSPTQLQVDSWVSSFLENATEWKSLVAVMAGGAAYRFGRVGAMATHFGVRAVSVGVGLATEAMAFELAHRGLLTLSPPHHLTPPASLWRWSGPEGIRQGLLTSLITFSSLKEAGSLARGENVLVQHLFQDTAMVLGHNVSGALGVTPRPTGSWVQQFLYAETMNVQISAGMVFVRSLSPQLHSLEHGMDFLIRSKSRSEGNSERSGAFLFRRQSLIAGAGYGKKNEAFFPLLWAMSENKGEKGGDDEWEEKTPVLTKQGENEWEEKTPPWTQQEAAWFKKATSPSSSPKSIRAAEQTHQVLRAFLLEPKQDMKAVEEGIEDYLTFCHTQEEGRQELYKGIMEVRGRARVFQSAKEKYQYLYTYTRLAENLNPRDFQFWGELESLGKNITDPHLPRALLDIMAGTFVKLSESLWRERPAVAHELKDTFEVLKFVYRHEKISSDLRGRAMAIYAEFRSFIEQE